MKLYSTGGKYVAAPKLVIGRRRKPAPASKVKTVPVVPPTAEAKPARTAKTTTKTASATGANSASKAVAARRKTNSKSRRKTKIWIIALLIFCLIIALTLLFLLGRKAKANNEFRQLAEQIQSNVKAETTAPPTVEDIAPTPTESTPDGMVPVETEPPVKTILPKYADLYRYNTEFFGWVRVDDTSLDYPVMRSHDDPEKYLYANFNGEYSYAGTPFADAACSHESDNIMIYGHNIRDGSMFRSLLKYEKESYWKKHPTIKFSDLYEDYEYEVLAAFYDRVYLKSDTCFKFYQFIDAENEADFDYAISQFKAKALYDTGVDAEYGDKLITLVTCAYHVENGRFVVVARRK